MITEDQQAVIDFLSAATTHDGQEVTRIDTHSATVFLAGSRAWKLKRAVRYDYLDFSTIERRRLACEGEVRLNRRTAPTVYRGVTPVTKQLDGSLALGGTGTPVDWLVEMNRFDDSQLLDRLAARQALGQELMRPLAETIARFHAAAEARRDYGGAAGMRRVVNGNAAGFEEFGGSVLEAAVYLRLTEKSLGEIHRHGALLEIRRAGGLVRQCHGDLHLRNIVLLNGEPTLFDAIEFNDDIACIDVLYDLAFLLMDLWRRHLPAHANAVWNGYLSEVGDHSGMCLLPLFLSCRAAVRAKTSATAARLQVDPASRADLEQAARDYLAMAQQFLDPAPPLVVALGGFSGTGKSTLARALAAGLGAPPGAVWLRSDELRKRLCGVPPLERLGPAGYTTDVSRRVYAALVAQGTAVVQAGFAAIADAVYARPEDRYGIEQIAHDRNIPFVGLWLDAPEPLLVERLQRRTGDVSDADADVLRTQSAQDIGAVRWQRLDASRPVAAVMADAMSAVAAATGVTC